MNSFIKRNPGLFAVLAAMVISGVIIIAFALIPNKAPAHDHGKHDHGIEQVNPGVPMPGLTNKVMPF